MQYANIPEMPALYLTVFDEDAAPDCSLLRKLDMRQRERLCRFSPAAQYRSLNAWLLVRTLACMQLGLQNHELEVATGRNGKPYFAGLQGFDFSISHTKSAVAVGVARQAVGADIELIRPINAQIAGRYFTAAEQAYVSVDKPHWERRFFEVWTRKEAHIKRTGKGLATPLSSFETLVGPQAATIHTVPWEDYIVSFSCELLPLTVRPLEITKEQLHTAARELSDCP